MSGAAFAGDWEGDTSGDWDDASNWVGDAAPVDGTSINIDIVAEDPLNAASITSATTNNVLPGSALFVGVLSGSDAELTISDGGQLQVKTGDIGANMGATGAVTVTGTGSVWTMSGQLNVGADGTGTMTIATGGVVSSLRGSIGSYPDSNGAVTVTGEGSNWTNDESVVVGFSGNGVLEIYDGGTVEGAEGYVGAGVSGSGSVIVSGAGSSWMNSSALAVGYGGSGSLLVENGGQVTSASGVISDMDGSSGEAIVTGEGSAWTMDGELRVGSGDDGSLTIADGGYVSSAGGNIGYEAGATGNATVTGAGSTWFNGTGANAKIVYIGYFGSGELTIEDSGQMDGGVLYMATAPDSYGRLTVTGPDSAWTNHLLSQIGIQGTAEILIEDGGTITQGEGNVFLGVSSVGIGAVTVTGAGSAWTNMYFFGVGDQGTGSLTVSNGGLVSGRIAMFVGSGAGSDGTVNVGAAAGEAPMAPGVIDFPSFEFYSGDGRLVFNHTDETGDYEFTPSITSGAGAATIAHYAGFTRLTGDGSAYARATDVHGGTLAIDNMLGGQVNVLSGGALTGTGVATGNVTFNSGSTYLVDMDGSTDPQGLTVSGLATLDGSVVIEGDYMEVAGEGPVVILTTDTTLTTTFDSAEVASVFFTPSLSYEMDGGTDYVYVSIEQDKTFSDFADTRNRLAVAGGLESLASDNPLAATMLTLTNEGVVVDAYDQLSGEIHASLKGALIENGQQAVKAINNRIHDAFEADANSSVAAYGDTHDPASGFWITGYGDWMSTEATGNTAAMDNALYGVIAGIDHRFGDHFRFGVLGGYSRTDTTIDALSSEAEADSYTIGLYGGADNGQAGLSLGALYTWHSIDSRRYVTNPVTEELAADYDAGSFQLFAEAGYKVAMEQATLEPFAGVSYINLQTDSFAESGGLAALSSPSQSTSTTFTTLGLRSSMTFASNVHARGMIGWRHAFGDVDPASTMTIGGGSPFTIVGAPIAQDAAVVEAGIDIKAGQNVMIGASYEGQYGDGAIANGFNARFLATF
ncbi:autotransporter domain-containing protein [Hoeflea sp. CAU 1731]